MLRQEGKLEVYKSSDESIVWTAPYDGPDDYHYRLRFNADKELCIEKSVSTHNEYAFEPVYCISEAKFGPASVT